MKKDEFFNLMHSIPKAELHVHEEAVLSLNTIKKVYERSLENPFLQGNFLLYSNTRIFRDFWTLS